jgi:ATP-dependent RNA helicase DDX21
VSNFNICKVLRDKLKSKGIESLFPIQAQTFDAVFTGNDMVGRARTGQVGLRASFHGTVFQLLHSDF